MHNEALERGRGIVNQAKKDSRKGNYRVYNGYKNELWELPLATIVIEALQRELIKAMGV